MRQPRTPVVSLARLLVLMLLTFGLLAPSASAASVYPLPTTGAGTVSATTVHPGDCVQFSGGGFKPGTLITIRDNGKVIGTTHADSNGNFTYLVCFATDAALGKHVLTASGIGANGEFRVVTAIVYLVGAEISGNGGGNGSGAGAGDGSGSNGGGGGLPFTGSDVQDLMLFGLVLVTMGAFLVHRGRTARASRRAARASA